MASPGVKRQLPRQLEQIRILTWFQFHLSVLSMLVALAAGVLQSGQADRAFLMTDQSARRGAAAMLLLLLVLGGTAVFLGVAAATASRGWAIAFPLVILAELAVLVDVWLTVRAWLASEVLGALTVLFGVLFGVVCVLLIALGGWIAARLLHREVLTFLLRPSRA